MNPKERDKQGWKGGSYRITRSYDLEAHRIIPWGPVQLAEEARGGGGRRRLGVPRQRLGRRRGVEPGSVRRRRAGAPRAQQLGGAFPNPHGRSTAAELIAEGGSTDLGGATGSSRVWLWLPSLSLSLARSLSRSLEYFSFTINLLGFSISNDDLLEQHLPYIYPSKHLSID